MKKQTLTHGIILALLAATLYALNFPLSKILLQNVPSTVLAGLLYLGAGLGMSLIGLVKRISRKPSAEQKLSVKELPYTVAMVVLDIAAPIFLMMGLRATSAANASLLNNFEIVATAIIALIIFREAISPRLWIGIVFVVASCALLSFEDITSLQFSYGSLWILLACICWGFENNCTRKLSSCDPLQIVVIKGLFSGLGSLVIGLCIGERISLLWTVFAALGVGFVAYGMSIFCYVHAQRLLGAARTSAYYAVSPFVGVLLSLLLFRSLPSYLFWIALALMLIATWLCSSDKPLFRRKPDPTQEPPKQVESPVDDSLNQPIEPKR